MYTYLSYLLVKNTPKNWLDLGLIFDNGMKQKSVKLDRVSRSNCQNLENNNTNKKKAFKIQFILYVYTITLELI